MTCMALAHCILGKFLRVVCHKYKSKIIHTFHPISPLQFTSLHSTSLHFTPHIYPHYWTFRHHAGIYLSTIQHVSVSFPYLIHSWDFPVLSKPQLVWGRYDKPHITLQGDICRDGTVGHITNSKAYVRYLSLQPHL